MEHFNYKGGYDVRERTHIKEFIKEELAWAIDKQLQVISNKMLFNIVIATTKKLKKKALNNVVAMRCYVALSNVF